MGPARESPWPPLPRRKTGSAPESRAAASVGIPGLLLEMPEQWSWATPGKGVRLEGDGADAAAARLCARSVELPVDPGDADEKTERGAAGECRHARPGGRELPIKQHRWQVPPRPFLRGE